MTQTTPLNCSRLARKFHELVREALPEHLETIDEENRTAAEHTCATHDYCDANMIMDEAFTAVLGHDMDAGSEDDVTLWNAAWDLALWHGFSNKEW